MAAKDSNACIYRNSMLSIPSLFDGCLIQLHILTIMNSSALNIDEQARVLC